APAERLRYRIERSWLLTYGFLLLFCPGRWRVAIQLEAALANERTLDGQVAIVTGGVRRLRRALASAPARDGAAVVINARSSREEAERTAAEVEKAGARALVHLADVTDEAAVGKMVDTVIKSFGRVDILINNAAVRAEAHFLDMSLKQW